MILRVNNCVLKPAKLEWLVCMQLVLISSHSWVLSQLIPEGSKVRCPVTTLWVARGMFVNRWMLQLLLYVYLALGHLENVFSRPPSACWMLNELFKLLGLELDSLRLELIITTVEAFLRFMNSSTSLNCFSHYLLLTVSQTHKNIHWLCRNKVISPYYIA